MCYDSHGWLLLVSQANELTQQIIAFIHQSGGYAWRASSVGIWDAQRGLRRTSPKRGVSDILACFRGRMIAIEVKISSDRLSAEQEGFLKSIQHFGGLAYVAKNFVGFQDWWISEVHQK